MRFKIAYGSMNSKARQHQGAMKRMEVDGYDVRYTAYEQIGELEIWRDQNRIMTIEDRGPGMKLWLTIAVDVDGKTEYAKYFLARYPLPAFLRSKAPKEASLVAHRITKEFNRRYRQCVWSKSIIGEAIADSRYEKEERAKVEKAIRGQFGNLDKP